MIANDIVAQNAENDELNTFLKNNLSESTYSAWQDFVFNKLQDINEKQAVVLVSI